MIKNLVSKLNEEAVGSKGINVILKYSREGKGGEASGLLHTLVS